MLLDMRMTLGGRFARKPLADAIIYALFANGEQGGVYCPYDLTDEKLAWVAANEPNLVTNGSFDTDLSGWEQSQTNYWEWDNGRALHNNGALFRSLYQHIDSDNPVTVSFNLQHVQGGCRLYLYTKNGDLHTQSLFTTTGTFTLTAPSLSQIAFAAGGGGSGIFSIDDIVVKSPITSAQFMTAFPNHTLFQNALGTIPVTGHSQPVGLVLDKSGRNNHASQPLSARRPLWQNNGGLKSFYFDGLDDFLELPIVLASSPEVFYCGYAHVTNTSLQRNALEFSSDDGKNGVRALFSNSWVFQSGTGTGRTTISTNNANTVALLTSYTSQNTLYARVNGVSSGSAVHSTYAPNLGVSYIGKQKSGAFFSGAFFSGHIGIVVITNYAPPLSVIQQVESYIATRSGVTL